MKTRAKAISIYVQASFDYSHFLPEHDRCFPLHGHTSVVRLAVTGSLDSNGMVIDFSEAKRLLNETLELFDHKLVTAKRYSVQDARDIVVHYGGYSFRLPQGQVCLLDGEATSENINRALATMLAGKMPSNVSSISLEISEGANKGSHLEISLDKGQCTEL